MEDKEFMEELLKNIPTHCRTVEEGQYTYANLRIMIANHLREPSVGDYK